MSKHLATFPLFGSNPITGRVWTNHRVGTGYITKPEQIEAERKRLELRGHPFRLRWRNEECRASYHEWLEKNEGRS